MTDKLKEIRLPDIGDFDQVDVIEVLVAPGDRVQRESSLITLESEKATMEVPSPEAGTVREVKVAIGDKVGQGDVILLLETADAQRPTAPPPRGDEHEPIASDPTAATGATGAKTELQVEVLVLGAGPGGYSAAFRAADLGKQVALVERYPTLGGVCLNVGCIPSKALLHVAEVITEAAAMEAWGVRFDRPSIDTKRLRAWKDEVVGKLTGGLAKLARQRQVQVIQGTGRFAGSHELLVERPDGTRLRIGFQQAIIAAGSRPVRLPGLPYDDPRLLDSTSALELPHIGGDLLVIGGGVIGLELAAVYHALGSRVTLVERSEHIGMGIDRDLIRPLQRRIRGLYQDIFLNTGIKGLEPRDDGLLAHFEGSGAPPSKRFDHVLLAVGRRPNGDRIGAEQAGIEVDGKGTVLVDEQLRTNLPHVYAIGDIIGHPQLAHKASHEGKLAAENTAGMRRAMHARAIPFVVYTDPEIAWAGITEEQAQAQDVRYGKGSFPWSASGRSLAMGRNEGLTKILFDEETGRVIGMGIVGPRAGELIAEGALAIEMGADAEDLALTIHPHPTLTETVMMAAEAYQGTITDLYLPKGKAGGQG